MPKRVAILFLTELKQQKPDLTRAAVKKILDEETGPNLESFASTLAIMNIKRALHYTGRLYDEFVFLRAVFLFPFNI